MTTEAEETARQPAFPSRRECIDAAVYHARRASDLLARMDAIVAGTFVDTNEESAALLDSVRITSAGASASAQTSQAWSNVAAVLYGGQPQ